MSFISKNSNQQLPDDDGEDSVNKEVTDADIEELENMLPFQKLLPTHHELCIFKAAQNILQNSMGTISMLSLTSAIKLDASNQLVQDCLLIFTGKLFKYDSSVMS
ncbi:unnamed protein product [Rotaria sp. Silwood2]|nr:unnamed protein product [Rotaria sp. Silwood2]CAF4006588.1 unnamed protein product [Rotaria sp. Silwood2]